MTEEPGTGSAGGATGAAGRAAPNADRTAGAAPPLPGVWRTWWRLRVATGKRLGTAVALARNHPLVEAGPGCVLHPSLSLRPFPRTLRLRGAEGRLRVVLEGGNRLGRQVVVQGSGVLSMGAGSWAGAFCVFGVNDAIRIGRGVMIADAVTIRDSDHGMDDLTRPMHAQGYHASPVVIEDDVWIGHGASVLRGVTLGSGSVVAAGAVVTRDVPPRTVVGGVPARPIGRRGPEPEP